MPFNTMDESDILEAERHLGACPNPTGRLKLICKDGEGRLYQLWENQGTPKHWVWLPVPKVALDADENWP